MAYTLYITRKTDGWAEETDPAAITRPEWQQYVAGDPEMRLNDYANDPLHKGGDVDSDFAYESYLEGLAAWLGHSGEERAGEAVWFSHQGGQVVTDDPDAETLQKARAIAQALGARVKDDNGYLDEEAAAPVFGPQPEAERPAWETSDFRDFQTFASAEAAQPLLAALGRQGIAYRTLLDSGRPVFDPTFANQQRVGGFVVKLQLADFEPAGRLREQLNEQALASLPPDHYLYAFTDAELLDVLMKPDEWSSLDVTLAGHLLRQRGRDVSADTLALLRQRRLQELARPEESNRAWIWAGYLFALLGGAFGVLIGWQLHTHRKTLPDGRRVYAYSPADRRHGLRILVLALVVLTLVLVGRAAAWHPDYWQEIWVTE